jgi:DNA modification methylase
VIGTAQVIRANSRSLPLADNTVDLVVTSPPYFALRSYQDGGEHYAGQIGDEPTPAEFVASLLEVTRECVRVLKPSGSLWVNLGDKYSATSSPGPQSQKSTIGRHKGVDDVLPRRISPGAPPKSLIGIPWRYALACIDDLGLILRAEVIWSKPNGLPESVTDRVRRSHEQWFHFTLEPRYFSAVDEIRETYDTADRKGPRRSYPSGSASSMSADGEHQAMTGPFAGLPLNPLGKLQGSVWTIPTEPLRVPDHLGIDHFAAFPTEWPKRIIAGWSPSGVCVECGEGRRPVAEAQRPALDLAWRERQGRERDGTNGLGGSSLGTPAGERDRVITGYACACPEPTADTTPAVVLDPFGGTGTTAMVAKALGRHGISVDMSADYCRLAEWRTNDRDQLAKVLGIAKVEQQPPEQASIFDDLEVV